jgi:protein-tyrosine phosphatase
MIDLHAHILPELDDGAKDWQETLDMCAIAQNDGIHLIVATPHVKPGMYTPAKALILSKVVELNRLLSPGPSGVKPPMSGGVTPHGSLTILPGADNAFEPDILDQIEKGVALTLGADVPSPASRSRVPAVRYVLLELSDYFLFHQVKDLIRKLREKKIVPVLSHPERIAMIRRNYQCLQEFILAGALSQVTAMSITGEFGKEIKKFTRTLVKKNLAHVIATDAHSRDRRPPILSRAVSEVADLIGSDKAEAMVNGIPRAIIEGKEVNLTECGF